MSPAPAWAVTRLLAHSDDGPWAPSGGVVIDVVNDADGPAVNPPAQGGGRGGRPPAVGHPAFAARDRRTDRVLSWASGQWGGDPASVAAAEGTCWSGAAVPLTPHGPSLPADAQNPHAALAVMRAVLGGNLEYTGTLPTFPPRAAPEPPDADGGETDR